MKSCKKPVFATLVLAVLALLCWMSYPSLAAGGKVVADWLIVYLYQDVKGSAAPAVSNSGEARIYYDSTANAVKISQNGGAYANIAAASGTTNKIAKFSSASAVGDGSLSDSGTKITGTVPIRLGPVATPADRDDLFEAVYDSPADLRGFTTTVFSDTVFPVYAARRARGTAAAPSAVQQDDIIASFGANGYGATGFPTTGRAAFRVCAAQNWTDIAQGAYLAFYSTPNNSVSNNECGRFTNAGKLRVGYPGTLDGGIVFCNEHNTNNITISADTTSAAYNLILPAAQGAASTFLQNDGAGNLSWATGGVAGSNTQVQFNNAGAFGADAALTYDATANFLKTDILGFGYDSINVPHGIYTSRADNLGLAVYPPDPVFPGTVGTGSSPYLTLYPSGEIKKQNSAAAPNIVSIVRATNVVTVTFDNPHYLVPNDVVKFASTVMPTTGTAFQGQWRVLATPLTTTITITSVGPDETASTVGTMTKIAQVVIAPSATIVAQSTEPLQVGSMSFNTSVISAIAPRPIAASAAGTALTLQAANATAGHTTAGAAAGGAVNITAGNAARITSGNAAGGSIILTAGTGVGTGLRGTVQCPGAGANSTVIGPSAVSNSGNGVVIGDSSVASDVYAVAIGTTATASTNAVAIGLTPQALGSGDVAIGRIAECTTGGSSVAIGNGAKTSNASGVAVGAGAGTLSTYGTAVGASASANYRAVAVGYGANSIADSAALGLSATASGSTSTAIGQSTTASGTATTAIGSSASASGAYDTALGQSANASNSNTTAIGAYAVASNYTATALGCEATASAQYAVALGGKAKADVDYTHNTTGGSIISAAGAAATSATDRILYFSGQENIIFSEDMSITATINGTANVQTITIPANSTFYVNEVGVVVSAFTSIATQPTVTFGVTGDTTKFVGATLTTNLTALRKRERFVLTSGGDGETSLVATMTVQGAGTASIRFYFKGMLVRNE